MLGRVVVFLLLGCFLTAFVPDRKFFKSKSTRWIICANSNLVVNGSTNLNRFSCTINSYPKNDTIRVERDKQTKKIGLSGSMSMAVAGFDCKNRMMTSELRKTLKQNQFPEIKIDFVSIGGLPELENNPSRLTGIVDITIAGVKKRFDINYEISIDRNSQINMVAIRDVNFSDFNLVPPKKIGRLVQAKNRLAVELNLKMRAI